jgi:hypothetical protein
VGKVSDAANFREFLSENPRHTQGEEVPMRRVYVRLRPDQVDAIVRLAEREYREPHDQLALLVSQKLAELGLAEMGKWEPNGAVQVTA